MIRLDAIMSRLADGSELVHHLLIDMVIKGGIVVGGGLIVAIAMAILWKLLGSRR